MKTLGHAVRLVSTMPDRATGFSHRPEL